MSKFEIMVASTAEKVGSQLHALRKKQMPFATAAALTKTARHVSTDTGAAIGDHFKVRNKGLRKSFTFKRAEKKDWPKPRAIVHLKQRSEFMADHASGATRKSRDGSSRLAVPTTLVRRTATGRITKSKKPRAIRNRKKAVVEDVNGTTILRVRKGKRAKNQAGIFYTLHSRIKIRRTWPVEGDASTSFARRYPLEFDRALLAAVKSPRVREGRFTSGAGQAHWNRANKAVRAAK